MQQTVQVSLCHTVCYQVCMIYCCACTGFRGTPSAKRVCPDPKSNFHTIICDCEDANVQHCHCLCEECNLKPVSRTTAHRHLVNEANASDSSSGCGLQQEDEMALNNGLSEGDSVSDNDSGGDQDESTADGDQDRSSANYEALLELLCLKESHNMSNKCFEEILKWSNKQTSDERFPKSWPAVQKVLEAAGCILPKLFYICLHEDHPCHYDILDTDTAACRHCGRPGSVKYYYLSLISKVKAWAQQKTMCEKMLAHWKERSHWLQCDGDEPVIGSWGYPCKKEVWDGARFKELSYFWNQEKVLWYMFRHCLYCYWYIMKS